MHYSESGFDSIPRVARAASEVGLAVLSEALMRFMRGQALFNSSNVTLQSWPPKGDEAEDSPSAGCRRAAGA
eukprot:2388134-Pyramimonas_sp.AAC.1